jgi:hypothetical protein
VIDADEPVGFASVNRSAQGVPDILHRCPLSRAQPDWPGRLTY